MRKKWTVTGLMLLITVCVTSLAEAQRKEKVPTVNPGTYTTGKEDFYSSFWKEKYAGGAVASPGNMFMAAGQGFLLKQAVLNEVLPAESGSGNCTRDWETRYEGGVLVLTSRGPWLNKGTLKATDLTVSRCSYSVDEDGLLDFKITFSGKFDTAAFNFDVIANYSDIPAITYFAGSPVFQRGSYLDMVITISE